MTIPKIAVVFQDDALMVINKPPGLVVYTEKPSTEETVVTQAQQLASLAVGEGRYRAGIVHRLDRDTEGLMVLAKTDLSYVALKAQFKDRSVQKRYYALVYGNVSEDELDIQFPIGRSRVSRHKMSVAHIVPHTKRDAHTVVKVLRRFNTTTLVDVFLFTGRTHQIRVHLAHLGHYVIGDSIYAPKSKKVRVGGHLLQSYYLALQHPDTHEIREFSLPMSSRLHA